MNWNHCHDMTIAVDWDVKKQVKIAVKFKKGLSVCPDKIKVRYVSNKLKNTT